MDISQLNNFGTIAYSGIFLSCFSHEDKKCFHTMPEHSITHLYSGELIIEDGNKKTIINPNECVFIRRDHRLFMNKCGKKKQPYKGITLSFNRKILQEIYNNIKIHFSKKINIPISDQKVFKIKRNVEVISLFESLVPYFDRNITPNDKIVYFIKIAKQSKKKC